MTSIADLRKLDETHAFMLELAEQGDASIVLQTLASVLSAVASLDKVPVEHHYWHSVILNLNALADTCQQNEYEEETLFGGPSDDDWDMADAILNDSHFEREEE